MTTGCGDSRLDALIARFGRAQGFHSDAYRQGLLRRRVAARMRARGVADYDAYGRLLETDPGEARRLLEALTIHVSKFYRNPDVWDRLAAEVLPAVSAAAPGEVHCWSAGCAAGEEPYTLAMLWLEHRRRTGRPAQIRITATDYDAATLERARRAGYSSGALQELPVALRQRYCTGHDPVTVVPEVQGLVQWARHDLTCQPPPGGPYHLILCRNVAIYFDTPTQEQLCSGLADALAPGGYLVLGKVETLRGEARQRLVLEHPRERIYRRP